jgi:hypothetical protein
LPYAIAVPEEALFGTLGGDFTRLDVFMADAKHPAVGDQVAPNQAAPLCSKVVQPGPAEAGIVAFHQTGEPRLAAVETGTEMRCNVVRALDTGVNLRSILRHRDSP